MNTVIKKLFLPVLLFAAAAGIYAQDFPAGIDLDLNIRELDHAVKTGTAVPAEGTALILNGTVTARKVLDPEEATYTAQLTLASGEWVSSDDIEISECIIILQGPEFSQTVPARRSRRANPKEIELNSEILIYGHFLGVAETAEGLTAVIGASGYRKL